MKASRGFTLPELVAVMMLAGILSVSVLPKLQGALSFRDDAWRDQVEAALHYAHKSAISQSPAGALYFQPTGRVTTDGAGSSAVARTISIAGQSSIVLVGETGRVD